MKIINSKSSKKTLIHGISLIVLVITIIIIIILAGSIIVTITKNNSISSANEAIFKSDIKEYSSALNMYVSNKYMETLGDFKIDKFNKFLYNGTGDITGTIKEVLPDMKNKYASKFQIEKGKLLYVGTDSKEAKWLIEIGIKVRMLIIDENWVITGVRDFAYLYGTLIIPEEVTAISPGAFFKNIGLESIDFSQNDKITIIPDSAFVGCHNLKSIKFSDKIETIGIAAFTGCVSLESVVIPDSVKKIGREAFLNCVSLSNVKLSKNPEFKVIDSLVFSSTSLKTITFPDNITFISYNSISSNKLTEIYIPKNIISIGSFGSCPKLKEIKVDSKNTKYASNDGLLYSKDFSDLIKCPDAKTSIKLNSKLKNILPNSFSGCNELTSIEIPASVTNITRPDFTMCKKLTNLIVDPTNLNFTVIDGILYTKDKTRLISALDINENITLPKEVEKIDGNAFYNSSKLLRIDMSQSNVKVINTYTFGNCNNLSEAILPNVLESIYSQAFTYTSLTNITIPNSVKNINWIAFYINLFLDTVKIPASVTNVSQPFGNCPKLNNIIIDTDNPAYTSLNGVIYNKNMTELVCMPNNKTEFIVPNSVKVLKYGCCSYTHDLSTILLPQSLTTIEAAAFYYSTKIENITIPSSVVNINNDVFGQCQALKQINVEKEKNSILGMPWGAPYGVNTVKWKV
ncbi:MAG: leucine-rich repeat protein [Clostridia bacterium]